MSGPRASLYKLKFTGKTSSAAHIRIARAKVYLEIEIVKQWPSYRNKYTHTYTQSHAHLVTRTKDAVARYYIVCHLCCVQLKNGKEQKTSITNIWLHQIGPGALWTYMNVYSAAICWFEQAGCLCVHVYVRSHIYALCSSWPHSSIICIHYSYCHKGVRAGCVAWVHILENRN